MSSVEVIRKFFEADGGRKITTAEFQALSKAEREELAELAAKALGLVRSQRDGKTVYAAAA